MMRSIVRLKGVPAHIDRCVIVESKEGVQPAAVIVMPVGQHCEINFGQGDPQCFRVPCEQIRLPHIEQEFVLRRFHKQAEAVFRGKTTGGGILNQSCDFHVQFPWQ